MVQLCPWNEYVILPLENISWKVCERHVSISVHLLFSKRLSSKHTCSRILMHYAYMISLTSLLKTAKPLVRIDVSLFISMTLLTGAPVSFSSSHSRLDGFNSPHLTLLSFKLVYTWRSGLTEKEGLIWETSLGCSVPFNPIMFNRVSPFVELLDKFGRRLFCHHIIRYELVSLISPYMALLSAYSFVF